MPDHLASCPSIYGWLDRRMRFHRGRGRRMDNCAGAHVCVHLCVCLCVCACVCVCVCVCVGVRVRHIHAGTPFDARLRCVSELSRAKCASTSRAPNATTLACTPAPSCSADTQGVLYGYSTGTQRVLNGYSTGTHGARLGVRVVLEVLFAHKRVHVGPSRPEAARPSRSRRRCGRGEPGPRADVGG
jgi:hypothetical protein